MSYINLSNTHIGDDDLACLEGLSDIAVLDLSCTAVTDAGLVHLKHLGGLQMLVLVGTQVTESGLRELRQALPGLAILAWPAPAARPPRFLPASTRLDTSRVGSSVPTG
jgi:hypothetical protein